MAMVICARRDIWQAVMGKRTCWLAQTDLWAPLTVLSALARYLVPTAIARTRWMCRLALKTKTPGIPCPRYCNLYDVDKTPLFQR